jgi:hypothetical protein
MKTLDAVREYTGQPAPQIGEGPLAAAAPRLVAAFEAREAQRLHEAWQRSALVGQGPALDALERRFAELAQAELQDNALPMVARFDAYQAVKRARSRFAQDRGLRLCASHLERLWQQDALGYLTVGDVARLRAHYTSQFPKSAVAQVLEAEIPRVGFNTLPVHKFATMAAQIEGPTEEDRQAAYEAVCRVNGLAGNRPEQIRARALLRGLAEMTEEPQVYASPYASMGSEGVVERLSHRMAAFDDPILRAVGQAMPDPTAPDMGTEPMDPMSDPMGDPLDEAGINFGEDHEDSIPHEEEPGTIVEVDSPNTGEPLVLELELAEGEGEPGLDPGVEDPGLDDPGLDPPLDEGAIPTEDPIAPGVVASLAYFGQAEEFAGPESEDDGGNPFGGDDAPPDGGDDFPAEEGDADLPMPEEANPVSVVEIEDPSSPGDMLEVEIRSVEEPEHEASGPLPQPMGMDARRRYVVHAVSAGQTHPEPLEHLRAASMPAALRHVANRLRQTHGQTNLPIHAHPDALAFEAFVVLDDAQGNYLRIRAEADEDAGEDSPPSNDSPAERKRRTPKLKAPNFEPSINAQQPGQVAVPENGLTALTDSREHKQKRPNLKVPHISKDATALESRDIHAICAGLHLSTTELEDRLLTGEVVEAYGSRIAVLEDGDVEVQFPSGPVRRASFLDLDRAIADFQARVAVAATQHAVDPRGRPAPSTPAPGPRYAFRPLFDVGCAGCGQVSEYLMPKVAADVTCGTCGALTPKEAVAIQLGARQASFPGYILRSEIPGPDQQLNAKRLFRAIQEVVGDVYGEIAADGQLEVQVRQADQAALNRIRRVLEDRFGVREFSAQTTPPLPGTQHATSPLPMGQPGQTPVDPALATAPVAQRPMPPGGQMPMGSGAPPAPAPSPGAPPAPGQPPLPHAGSRALPIGEALYHVCYVDPLTQRQAWLAVEAANERAAALAFSSYNDGTKVLAVRHSREAQFGGPAPAPSGPGGGGGGPPPMGPPPGGEGGGPGGDDGGGFGGPSDMGLDMGPGPGGGGNGYQMPFAQNGDDPEVVIRDAMHHYRRTGLPLDRAIDAFSSAYKRYMDSFGDDDSPMRQKVGGSVAEIALEIYRKPAIRQPEASRQAAGMPTPKNIKPSKGDRVKVPKRPLGKDSETDSKLNNAANPGKIRQQHPPKGKMSPKNLGEESDSRDPGSFGAPKPPAGGSVNKPSRNKGTSLTPTSLGKDTENDDNETTRKWDSVSSGARAQPNKRGHVADDGYGEALEG